MGQRFASFGEVERLDAESLKALLVGGEPPERVWAAWALGLRHHEAFARELRATAAEEPHAGVRRHLVVVLAGAGERRSVLTMAAHNPDERVRATALQYVARLAGPGDDDANRLVADALAQAPPLLRLGCIAGLRADAPPALWAAVEACVGSADPDLRWAAYDAALRHGAVAHPAPELARALLNHEPEPSHARRGDAAPPRACRVRGPGPPSPTVRWTRTFFRRRSTRSRRTASRCRGRGGEADGALSKRPTSGAGAARRQRGPRAFCAVAPVLGRPPCRGSLAGLVEGGGAVPESGYGARWTKIVGRSTNRSDVCARSWRTSSTRRLIRRATIRISSTRSIRSGRWRYRRAR